MSENNHDKNDKRGKKGKEKRDYSLLFAASQFAYTLVAATCLLGFIGHWLGGFLGGGLWSIGLMLLLGGLGFAAETWRMIKTVEQLQKSIDKDKEADADGKKTDGDRTDDGFKSEDEDGGGSDKREDPEDR